MKYLRTAAALLALLVLTVANVLMAMFVGLYWLATGERPNVFPLVKQDERRELDEWVEALADELGSAIPRTPKHGRIAGKRVLGNSYTPEEMERLVSAEAEEQF